MDIQMPVMDGITAAQKIRAGEAGELKKNIPVIAVTAHAVTADRAKCIEARMNDYLTKPVRPDVLRAALIKNLAG
jgi:CheY-like chemotaxis protein